MKKHEFDREMHARNLIVARDYESLIEMYLPFLRAHVAYIKSKLKICSEPTKDLDDFLKGCGKESYFCVRKYYCRRDSDEVWSDVYTCFIVLADRYEDQGFCFSAYLKNAFYFEFGRTIFKYLKNPIVHTGLGSTMNTVKETVPYENTIEENFDKICGYETSNGHLTKLWCNDNHEDSLFHSLSNKERLLILYYYQHNLRDKDIVDIMERHINTINQMRRKAVNSLGDIHGLKVQRARRVSSKKEKVVERSR